MSIASDLIDTLQGSEIGAAEQQALGTLSNPPSIPSITQQQIQSEISGAFDALGLLVQQTSVTATAYESQVYELASGGLSIAKLTDTVTMVSGTESAIFTEYLVPALDQYTSFRDGIYSQITGSLSSADAAVNTVSDAYQGVNLGLTGPLPDPFFLSAQSLYDFADIPGKAHLISGLENTIVSSAPALPTFDGSSAINTIFDVASAANSTAQAGYVEAYSQVSNLIFSPDLVASITSIPNQQSVVLVSHYVHS